MNKKILIILFAFLSSTLPLKAQPPGFEISGYVKYLSSASEYPGIEGTLYDQLIHTRINTAWYRSDSLRGEMD